MSVFSVLLSIFFNIFGISPKLFSNFSAAEFYSLELTDIFFDASSRFEIFLITDEFEKNEDTIANRAKTNEVIVKVGSKNSFF